ncbi:hypothetical protein [Paraburkholderia tropica]|uniref:hypothetical protein n=1 Tax=Paraburkholderia tropica TaxID=92647 RepID=UPI002AAFE372|nr:hypothetical protein [Paraburkholderia tropica]
MSVDKKLAQIAEGRYVDAGFTENQSGAHGCIEHPSGNDPNLTVARVNMDDSTSTTLLHISNLDATAIQRMPTILDFDFLPDMGRMNGNWWLVAYFTPSWTAISRQAGRAFHVKVDTDFTASWTAISPEAGQ